MAAAQARIEQARARVQQAAASWWPTLDLRASGDRQRLSNTNYQYNQALASIAPHMNTDQTVENYNAGLQATWVLFDGFYRDFKEQQATYDQGANAASMVDSQRLLVIV